MWNGLEIDVPAGWADTSTIVLAPKTALSAGEKPSVNLIVKRRPVRQDETEAAMNGYLKFMHEQFGELTELKTATLSGSPKTRSVSFSATADGVSFRQYTVLFYAPLPGAGAGVGGEEISATVTQLAGDPTPAHEIDKLLRSVRHSAMSGALRGGR